MQLEFSAAIIVLMELIGTIAFAASGAMVGIDQDMDIFGVVVLGVVTAVGGGTIRDVILGNTPPGAFLHSGNVLIAAVTSCIVFITVALGHRHRPTYLKRVYDRMMLLMDTLGLGIFTVLGVNTGIVSGYEDQIFLLVFVGTITGVGGGLLRDMMAGVPPMIFVKHIYACASVLGALIYVLLRNAWGNTEAMLLGFAAVLLVRFLAIYNQWNLPRAKHGNIRERQ